MCGSGLGGTGQCKIVWQICSIEPQPGLEAPPTTRAIRLLFEVQTCCNCGHGGNGSRPNAKNISCSKQARRQQTAHSSGTNEGKRTVTTEGNMLVAFKYSRHPPCAGHWPHNLGAGLQIRILVWNSSCELVLSWYYFYFLCPSIVRLGYPYPRIGGRTTPRKTGGTTADEISALQPRHKHRPIPG